jgi:hypothetical protein
MLDASLLLYFCADLLRLFVSALVARWQVKKEQLDAHAPALRGF